MTSLNTQLHFNVRITGIPNNSFSADTYQNIKKPIADILYLSSLPKDAVKLAYIGSKEISPKVDLYIGDRSDSLHENLVSTAKTEFVSDATTVNIKTKNFIVTQIANGTAPNYIPLYYKHIINEDVDHVLNTSIKIFDKDFVEVPESQYRVVLTYNYNEDTGQPTTPSHYTIYNSLESSFNDITGEYKVYFLQYVSLASSTNQVKTLLLENKNAYKEALYSDFWYVNGELKPWEDVYSISDNFVLKVGRALPLFIKYNNENRLMVVEPSENTDEAPWYLRIINGVFDSIYNVYSLRYKITEFQNQAFNPVEPYKLASFSSCKKITDSLIKLPHGNVDYSFSLSFLKIEIFDKDTNPVYAITNDPVLSGSNYVTFDNKLVYDKDKTIIKWNSSSLLGIDKLTGIVSLDLDIKDDYDIRATYTYIEDKYQLTSLNMNPIFDRTLRLETRVIYIVPQNCPTWSSTSQTESVRWLKIDSSGRIRETNQTRIGGNENLSIPVKLSDPNGFSILGAIGLHYNKLATTSVSESQKIIHGGLIRVENTTGFPSSGWLRFLDTQGKIRYSKYVKKTNTSFILSSSSSECINDFYTGATSFIELVSFTNERTTLSNRNYAIENSRSYRTDGAIAVPTIPVHCSRYFVLAELAVNPPHGIKDIVKIDVREDGGGLIEEKYDEAKAKNPKAQWYPNVSNYDGQIYPGKAVVVIKLPISIKQNFTEGQIQEIVSENIAFGVMPIIQYYGYQPVITSISVKD